MTQAKNALIILISTLTAFNFVLAQGADIPPEIMEQYQRQMNNPGNNPSIPENPPPTNLPTPAIESKEKQAITQDKELPAEEKNSVPLNEVMSQSGIQAQNPEISQGTPPLPQTVDSVSIENPNLSSLAFYFAFVVAIGFVLFWFGWWRELLKRKKSGLPSEAEKETVPCATCGGSGKISKKRTKLIDCPKCKGAGKEICRYCNGTGRYGVGLTVPQTKEDLENYMKCDYCGGTGVSKPLVSCSMCKGEKKIGIEESYEVTCPTCKGAGHIIK